MSVTAVGPMSPQGHVDKFYDRLMLIRSVLRASTFFEIETLCVYYTIPFVSGTSEQYFFQVLKPLCLAKYHWWGLITQNAHMVYTVY